MAVSENPMELFRRGLELLPTWIAQRRDEESGAVAIELREFADRGEAYHAEALRRFEKSGAWAADGSLSGNNGWTTVPPTRGRPQVRSA